jgi:hypothetical protein
MEDEQKTSTTLANFPPAGSSGASQVHRLLDVLSKLRKRKTKECQGRGFLKKQL